MSSDSQTIAKIYDTHGQQYHDSRMTAGRLHNEFIDIPATLAALPQDLKNKKILDAGCGSGIYSILLAQKGVQVTGIDISKTMIDIAKKETPKELHISYIVGDLYHLPFANESFDIVLSTYVLENIENLQRVFAEFARVLPFSGICVFSASHPLRANSKKKIAGGKEVWEMEDYFAKGIRQSDFGNGMVAPKYKRTIQDYATQLLRAGFVITKILEPQPIEKGKDIDPDGYEKAMRLPQLLTIVAKKE